MRVWFTLAEMADAVVDGLLDLPQRTERALRARADREGWADHPAHARPRPGRTGGGGLEYHIELLPAHVRLEYLSRFAAVTPAASTPTIPSESEPLTTAGRRARDARIAVLRAADAYRAGNRLSVAASDTYFAALWTAGKVEIAPWVRASIKKLSCRTLARWRSAGRTDPGRLAYDPALNRKGTGALERLHGGAVRDLILGLLAKNPFLSAEHIRNTVIGSFGSLGLPGLRGFQTQLAAWRASYRNELMKVSDPDGYRSRVEFVATGTSTAVRLNEVWQIDASPLDAIMLSGRRHTIYAAVDVFSRRVIILVSETPRAAAVAMLLRKCILAWGVPERIKTDNGSDFVAHATQRLITALGVEIELAPPYTPRAKAIVERAIGTFQRDFAATLPGFIGHSVADRRIIEGRKAFSRRLGLDDAHLFDADMTEAEAQAYADAWAGEIYERTHHDGIGTTPFAKAASFEGAVRRIADLAALDVLLMPVAGLDGRRKVTKTGILVDGEHYLIGSVMPGTPVFCRRDPADLGRLHVFAEDGETYLGRAVCPALAGLDPVATASRVKAEQRAFMEGRIKPIRAAMRKIGPRQVADAQLVAARERSGTLVAFPARSEPHSTPALEGASSVSAVNEAEPLGETAQRTHEQLVAGQLGGGNVRRLRQEETPQQRFRRALDIHERTARGDAVAADDLIWLGGYRDGPEYRAMTRMREQFGDAMRL